MATKKKIAPKTSAKKAAARQPGRQSNPTVDSVTVRFLIVSFTFLCVLFALVAFWRYS
jgi:hypothetical protein